jgi:hypothetical protein
MEGEIVAVGRAPGQWAMSADVRKVIASCSANGPARNKLTVIDHEGGGRHGRHRRPVAIAKGGVRHGCQHLNREQKRWKEVRLAATRAA